MKQILPFIMAMLVLPNIVDAQIDYYGPKPFSDILNNSKIDIWTPSAVSAITNRKFVVIMNEAKSKIISLNSSNIGQIELSDITNITGGSATYGSLLRGVFQIVDENSHFENGVSGGSGTYMPLSGLYKVNPFLHSYYNLNSSSTFDAISTDGGSYYISDATNTGYLLVQFVGAASSTIIKAVSKWKYNAVSASLVEDASWADSYLMISENSLKWTTTIGSATIFFLADATDLIDLEIGDGSAFNPRSISYQTNATAALPSGTKGMEESRIIKDLPNKLDPNLLSQLGKSANSTSAATAMLDVIETTLKNNSSALRYPKAFYLAVRENMLSHKIASSDIFNAVLGNRTIEHVYFTNALDDAGVPHPFMVIASHIAATRPNLLINVNRPPGATAGTGYAQSTVTRNAKLGEFLVKIPLKDYGLITNLLDNDLSPYGDLASDFDKSKGTTTTKDVFNYTALASIGMAVDGFSIYPAVNNNLRFAVEDAEVTSSGIHVGGGLELHYHADGHAFNSNGINLYNISDYSTKNHPPVIGMSYDGITLFGRYDSSFSAMAGYSISLDQFGGHDHRDGFGYHYHAHTKSTISTAGPTFNEHFLLVGAWKGNINNIPGFLEVKDNQLRETDTGRFAGAPYIALSNQNFELEHSIFIYPNPTLDYVTVKSKISCEITIFNFDGKLMQKTELQSGSNEISLKGYSKGIYFIKLTTLEGSIVKKIILN